MDFKDLVSSAKNKMVLLREITIAPVPLHHQVEGQQPLRRRLAKGLLTIGIILSATGLVGLAMAPMSDRSVRRGHQMELLQLEQQLRPMPSAEYKRRFEEILKK